MKNAEFPASGIPETDHSPFYGGLTKREMFAMHMMAANRSRNSDYYSWADMAKDAIEMTDALLEALEQAK